MEISEKVKQVDFSFFSAEDIKRLSVVEIKNPIAFDSLKNPCSEGLYDPLMGANPYDRLVKCPTCQKQEQQCPGHMGHIQLVCPVYNLFLTKNVLKLMRSKCFYCHRILLTRKKQLWYQTLLKMINLGLFKQFSEYQSLSKITSTLADLALNPVVSTEIAKVQGKKKSEKGKGGNQKPTKKETEINLQFMAALKEGLVSVKDQLEQIEKDIDNLKDEYDTSETSFKHYIKQLLLKEFFKDCISNAKCLYCHQHKPTIKLENNAKFYAHFRNGQIDDGEQKVQMLNPWEVKRHLNTMFEVNDRMLTSLFAKYETSKTIRQNVPKGYVIQKFNPNYFLIEVLPVTPNRFRPESRINNQSFLHSHTLMYTKVLTLNEEIKALIRDHSNTINPEEVNVKTLEQINNLERQGDGADAKKSKNSRNGKGKNDDKAPPSKAELLRQLFSKWIELQETINFLFDTNQTFKANEKESGIKQILEKKEGIFRMKIMGKRVNYAARSVISPDPNLETSEVGIPIFMARKLTYPEAVNEHNVEFLRRLIVNGPQIYPGALSIEENGVKKNLEGSSIEQRMAIANRLLENCENKTVFRQMMSGDYVLFNRQPTLHKPSLMSFKARVLPRELTIRMHYTNCAGFNADFDGDEMNVHLLQNYLARSEAKHISLADRQYILPTSKAPVRGFIQDFIFAALFITSKDTLLSFSEYTHLLYCALTNVLDDSNHISAIKIEPPAIRFPSKLWTGKQLFSNIINFVASLDGQTSYKANAEHQRIGLNMKSKARVNASYFCAVGPEEAYIVVRNNSIMCGVFDKNQIGASSFGFMHCFFELYGHEKTGQLFAAFTRVCTTFLKLFGFTCGMSDLITTPEFENKRKQLLETLLRDAIEKQIEHFKIDKIDLGNANLFDNITSSKLHKDKALKEQSLKVQNDHLAQNGIQNMRFRIAQKLQQISSAGLPSTVFSQNSELLKNVEKLVLENAKGSEEIDKIVKSGVVGPQSKLYSENASIGLKVKFPLNQMSAMVLTGAKGSVLNQNLISCNLGQQELEGKRVPAMSSGKTLPSFLPYDPNPRCGGFIADRFLTGLKPQEFFFHCMAGREGLIDTAVKTSRSGYLQRILVKNLESFVVEYDYTVRDIADKSLIQFYYGEDAINSMKVNVIENIEYLFDNYHGFKNALNEKNYESLFGQTLSQTKKFLKDRASQKNSTEEQESSSQPMKTLLEEFNPGKSLGAISEKALNMIEKFIASNKTKFKERKINEDEFRNLFYFKYFESLMSPGEAVGAVAAQSFGEPSTQMTLNTFHLAGHGGVNVTLGIPRLRELLTTKNTKSPVMFLPVKPNIPENDVKKLMRMMDQINLLELVAKINCKTKYMVTENGKLMNSNERSKVHKIVIEMENLQAIKAGFGFDEEDVKKIMQDNFMPKFVKVFKKILASQKKVEKKDVLASVHAVGKVSRKASSSNLKMDIEMVDSKDPENDYFTVEGDKDEVPEFGEEFENTFLFKNQKFFIALKTPLNSNHITIIK